jgi:Secretion system C-terminal sorting domain/PKD domain
MKQSLKLFFFLFLLGVNKINAQSTLAAFTDSVQNVTATSIEGVFIRVIFDGYNTARGGLCYSTSPNPTISNNVKYAIEHPCNCIISGNSYSVSLFSLVPEVTYYVRSFASDSTGVVYSDPMQITTVKPILAVETTDSITKITATSAFFSGSLINDSLDPETFTGFVYSTSPNFSKIDNFETSFSYIGYPIPFYASIYHLNPNTIYYVKAFATNAKGTSYGNVMQFTTEAAVLPKIRMDSVSEITATTAHLWSTLVFDGNDPSAFTGFCIGLSPKPTIKTTILNENNFFKYGTNIISSLIPDTTYYVRAYSKNAAGISYSNQKIFRTGSVSLPIVTTDSIIDINANSAGALGNLINNGNDPGIFGGFCYSTSPHPTIKDSVKLAFPYRDFIGFSVSYLRPFGGYIDGLLPNTTYYVRSFATNTAGTSYGIQIKFTTEAAVLPSVITDSVVNITSTSADIYGKIINNGNSTGGTCGFCYSTSPNPTLVDSTAQEFNVGYGIFEIAIDNLKPNTTYYVRAYVTNPAGTSFGNTIEFTTDNNSFCYAHYTTVYDTLQNTFILTVDTTLNNNIVSYKWDFGDGTTSTEPIPHHAYIYNCNYKITMKGYTSSGDSCEYASTIGNTYNFSRDGGFNLNSIQQDTITAISETQINSNTYTLMPNPTSGLVSIVFNKNVYNIGVSIVNITGQKIIEQNNLSGSKFTFDLSDQASCLYILEVNENGTFTRTKLLKYQ